MRDSKPAFRSLIEVWQAFRDLFDVLAGDMAELISRRRQKFLSKRNDGDKERAAPAAFIVTLEITLRTTSILLSFYAKKNETHKFVTFNFIKQNFSYQGVAASVAAIASLICFFVHQMGGGVVWASATVLILLHMAITKYRVVNGMFGTNEQEAAELINFIVQHANRSGTPPGSKISPAETTRAENSSLHGEIFGVVR